MNRVFFVVICLLPVAFLRMGNNSFHNVAGEGNKEIAKFQMVSNVNRGGMKENAKNTVIYLSNASELVPYEKIDFDLWDLITSIAISPVDSLLAVSAGESVHLFDVNSGKEYATIFVGAFSHALEFSHDGRKLAAGSRDGKVRIWSVQEITRSGDNEPLLTIDAHKKGVNSVAFSQDDSILASGGNDAIARIWDIDSGEKLNELIGGTFAVPDLAFSPKSGQLAVINGDTIRLRDPIESNILGTMVADDHLYDLDFDPSGEMIAVSNLNNQILLWDVNEAFHSGKESYPEPKVFMGHEGKASSYETLVWSIDFNYDGSLLASGGGDDSLRLWNPVDQSLVGTFYEHSNAVTSVRFNADGNLLATGGLDAQLILWHVE